MKVISYGNYVVMTKKKRTINMNFRAQPDVRTAFKAVARLRGDDISGMLNKFMVEEIRKEKERNHREFEEEILLVQEEEENEEKQKQRNKGKKLSIDVEHLTRQKDLLIESKSTDSVNAKKEGTNN